MNTHETHPKLGSKKPPRKKTHMGRLVLLFSVFLLQIAFIIWALIYMHVFALVAYIVFQIIAAILAISIVASDRNPSYQIAWISLILAVPFLGLIFYLMWGRAKNPRKVRKQIPLLAEMHIPRYTWNTGFDDMLQKDYPTQMRVSEYLSHSGFPLYKNTSVKYYSLGDDFYPAMLDALRSAKKFIFIETFILSEGSMWDEIYEILQEKAKQGVDVRLVYDDFGSLSTVPRDFATKNSRPNLQICIFNKIYPFLNNFYINYRNHEKICVVDGNIGFTGGLNIADEYINRVEAFGHWKDSGLRLEGTGVWSLTVTFLQMWQYAHADRKNRVTTPDWEKYLPAHSDTHKLAIESRSDGYVQPMCDGPVDAPNNPAEFLYIQTLNNARKYVYITTPYLVIDNELATALKLASLSGVDVRIITPGVPDKKFVYAVTRAFYGSLLKAGVKIYEYKPGFIHAKNVVSDDETAIVGTINMDYRSFYINFENAVWMCGNSSVKDIKDDFLATLDECEEITYEKWMKRPLWYKALGNVLRLFAPTL